MGGVTFESYTGTIVWCKKNAPTRHWYGDITDFCTIFGDMGGQTVYKEDTLQEMVHTTKTKITPEQSNTILSFQSQTSAYLAGPKGDDSGNGTHHFSRMKTHMEFDSTDGDSGLFNKMEASMDMLGV